MATYYAETAKTKHTTFGAARAAEIRALRRLGAYEGGIYKDGYFWRSVSVRYNPAASLPKIWTSAQVRVNSKGQVQLKINPAKLGSGGRFASCVRDVKARGGATDPYAVCAAAGRAKYGKRRFQSMAAKGLRRAIRRRSISNPKIRIEGVLRTVYWRDGGKGEPLVKWQGQWRRLEKYHGEWQFGGMQVSVYEDREPPSSIRGKSNRTKSKNRRRFN